MVDVRGLLPVACGLLSDVWKVVPCCLTIVVWCLLLNDWVRGVLSVARGLLSVV